MASAEPWLSTESIIIRACVLGWGSGLLILVGVLGCWVCVVLLLSAVFAVLAMVPCKVVLVPVSAFLTSDRMLLFGHTLPRDTPKSTQLKS